MTTSELETSLAQTQSWLSEELRAIRTGRASTALLDGIKVDSYGTPSPINQVASMNTEDARTIRIAPWDPSQIQAIEKAINDSGMGLSVSTDEKGVRVHFPQLTEETRANILKLAKAKHEEARVAVKHARNDAISEIEKAEKAGEMSEDEAKRAKDAVQKHVDTANKELDALYEKKEKEILG